MAQVGIDNPGIFPQPKPRVISSISVTPRYKQESFLRQKYEVEGLSIRQIAAQIFSARSVVSRSIREFGTPLREPSEQLRFDKGQMAYGERHTKVGVIRHLGQEEVVGLMIQLSSKDYSYRKIADELNRSEIPTKTGNAPWKATTVMKICKRASKSRHEVLGLL
jgi:hypothetical protein